MKTLRDWMRAAPFACCALLVFAGCGGETDVFGNSGGGGTTSSALCVPNQQIECPCGGGVEGIQACLPDGSGYSACECPEPTGGGGTGGTGPGGGGTAGTGGGGVCEPGEVMPCYTGPAGTQGVGVCVAGAATCLADGTGFGPCEGEVTPGEEDCASIGDEDCDGLVNEDCACAPGSQQSCYSGPDGTMGVGPCTGGMQQCNAMGTGYGPCVGEVTPAAETCNTPTDDDCDGMVNEEGAGCVCSPGAQTACYTGPNGTLGIGECKGGMHTCDAMGTGYGPCNGEVTPGRTSVRHRWTRTATARWCRVSARSRGARSSRRRTRSTPSWTWRSTPPATSSC